MGSVDNSQSQKKTLKVKHFKNYQQRLQSDVKDGRMSLVYVSEALSSTLNNILDEFSL